MVVEISSGNCNTCQRPEIYQQEQLGLHSSPDFQSGRAIVVAPRVGVGVGVSVGVGVGVGLLRLKFWLKCLFKSL